MAHTPKYANGIVLHPVVSLWAHVFQARQFQGKGDPRYDVSLVLNTEQNNQLGQAAYALAQEAFPAGEYSQPGFQWPMTPTEQKVKMPKLAELFPGHTVISAKAYEDNPPQVLIPKAGVAGEYEPMPESMRGQLVYDGALAVAVIDLASFVAGANTGIRCQLSSIVYYGAGQRVSVGSRPDAKKTLQDAGVNVTMQTPAPAAGAVPGQPAPAPAVQQQPVPGQPAPAPAVQQQAPVAAPLPFDAV